MTEKRFTCVLCNNNFISCWTDEQAEAEYTKTFGEHLGEERGVLCDECNELFMKWYTRLNKSKVQQ